MFTSIGTGSNVFERIAKEMTAYYLLSAEPEAERSRWPAAPHQGGRSIARTSTSARAASSRCARRPRRRPRPRSAWRGPPAAAAGDGIAHQGGDLQPADAGGVDGQGRRHDRVRAQRHCRRRGDRGLRRAHRQGQGGRDVNHGQQGGASADRGARARCKRPPSSRCRRGTYLLRLAVLDANGRAGSVEHPLDAGLATAGDLEVADLLLAPANAGTAAAVRLVADTTIEDEPFGAYIELYPRAAHVMRAREGDHRESPKARLAPAIASAEAARRRDEDTAPLRRTGAVAAGAGAARGVPRTRGGRHRRRTSVQMRPFRLARAVPAGLVFKTALSTPRRRLSTRPGADAGVAGAGHRRAHASWAGRRRPKPSRAWPTKWPPAGSRHSTRPRSATMPRSSRCSSAGWPTIGLAGSRTPRKEFRVDRAPVVGFPAGHLLSRRVLRRRRARPRGRGRVADVAWSATTRHRTSFSC